MLKARMTAEQIQLREGLEPTLVANEIARAVALGEGLPETFFDYGCVPQESRAEVYELTKSVKDARGRHLAVIVEIGGTLRRAKELLGHGNFLPWLKAEFRWSERTARNYMSLAAHFQDKTANFADLDLGTARELIDSPAEVSEPIMRRAEAGETISQEEVKAALRISRPDCAPVTLPPRPAAKHVNLSQSWFAEPPTTPPRVDLREVGERSAGRYIARDLKDLAFQLSRFQSADKLVERLSADEREEVRLGIEAVMRIKAALDRLGQRNAQLHKERQRAP
jgi:Protein of unknown function (DUF3102)